MRSGGWRTGGQRNARRGRIPARPRIRVAKAPDAVVVRQVMAEPVCGDGHGLCTFGGLWQPSFMVFDLADRSRRVIGLMCEGEVTQDGRVVSETQCTADDLPSLRVGVSAGS
jgi:hypothetical protein